MLLIEGVDKIFTTGNSQVIALQGINMEVAPREFAVIVGPSGCGKTTLLRMAAGLDKPTAGRITLHGRPINGPGPDRGMVFQSYTLFPGCRSRTTLLLVPG